eukprot:CAMPEP_0118925252 /NCGR_PEP_ID=MMETSP1169-20130426/3179_1 /TAXON_ID=36882 /ORGANISM="Pyramimonas obovata, Strain CCMP722" /LENGTH=64 /DNA_ID=CAMNT_0006866503 /DNA_START=139 /DNA_END=333 /DNA_ORIENTATION=-
MKFLGNLFPFNMCSNVRAGHESPAPQTAPKRDTQAQPSSAESPFADVPDSDEVVTYRLNMSSGS